MAIFKCNDSEAGFSLAETIVATGILAVALVSLAQLFGVATASNRSARTTTFATVLAYQKMEQLRGLTYGFDSLGLPITDIATDTSVTPSPAAGGTGLTPSPGGALGSNTTGYVDYLDQFGTSLCAAAGSCGATPPTGTAYIRRWSVEPLPTNPNNTLVLQVLVTQRRNRGTADAGSVRRAPDEARIVSIKTRKAS